MSKAGRPPIFKTPEALAEKWKEFTTHCEETQGWINKDKFCLKYGYYSDIFNEYAKKPEFSGILTSIASECKGHLLEKGLKNEYNSAIVKLIASANYGMSEKKDLDIKADINVTMASLLDDDLVDG